MTKLEPAPVTPKAKVQPRKKENKEQKSSNKKNLCSIEKRKKKSGRNKHSKKEDGLKQPTVKEMIAKLEKGEQYPKLGRAKELGVVQQLRM